MRVVACSTSTWDHDGLVNVRRLETALDESGVLPHTGDVLVLPELAGADLGEAAYTDAVCDLANRHGCVVVGGSHHRTVSGVGIINSGVVANSAGQVIARYDKHRPYGSEHAAGVVGGPARGLFTLNGTRIAVLICADLWYSDLVLDIASSGIDMVLVPAFSITQWPTPGPARELWRHMSVARAYEFASFVVISDWPAGTVYGGIAAAGVSGLAVPVPVGDGDYFTPAIGPVATFELDADALAGFRGNRTDRGFRHGHRSNHDVRQPNRG